jgi:hypothetical protein
MSGDKIVRRGSFGQWTTEYVQTPHTMSGAEAARWASTRADAERRRDRAERARAERERARGGRERGRRGGRRAR